MTLKCNFKTQVVWFLISENNIIIYFMFVDQKKKLFYGLWSLYPKIPRLQRTSSPPTSETHARTDTSDGCQANLFNPIYKRALITDYSVVSYNKKMARGI